jgi:hypothetical protein
MTPLQLTQPDNLKANVRGQITEAQRGAARQVGTLFIFLVLFAVAAAGGGWFAFMGVLLLLEGLPAGYFLCGLALWLGGSLAAVCVFRLVGVVRAWQDLSEGRVEHAEGEVRWRGHRYAAEYPGRPVWTNNTVTGLAPGACRFYYLPRSGFLLSAQPLPGLTVAEGQGLADVLARVHRFGPEDLARNRNGQLSARQKARLARSALGFGLFGAGALAFMGFGSWGMALDDDPGKWIGIGVLLLIGVILGGLMAGLSLQLLRDAAQGSVKQAQGVVRRSMRSSGKSTSYYYHVEQKQFSVSAAAYAALPLDQAFRVYYTPRSRRIVGMEPL